MVANRQGSRRSGRRARPLDSARLEELALAYVARFATSAAKVEHYLQRKVRERGWEGESEPAIAALVERFVAHGYVDDAGYARARASDLLRRGYGERRVRQALGQAGIDSEIGDAVAPGEAAARRAALTLAAKRGFGPFGAEAPDRARREKQIAAMARAGHTLDNALAIVDAASEDEAREWVMEAEDDGDDELA